MEELGGNLNVIVKMNAQQKICEKKNERNIEHRVHNHK